MSKVMKRNCEECLHSEVCKLIEPIKAVEGSMGVIIEDCPHYLSGVNWVPEEEDSEDDCDNCSNCEYNAMCIHSKGDQEDNTPADSLKRQLVRSIIMSAVDKAFGSEVLEPSKKKMPIAPVDKERHIEKDLVSALHKVIEKGGKPVSVVLTTPQLKDLLQGTPITVEDAKNSNSGMMFRGLALDFKVNENITSSYVSYEEAR